MAPRWFKKTKNDYEEEVMSILEESSENGSLREEGKKMINAIFAFDDKLAHEIMTPRTDVFMIDIQDPQEEYMEQLMELRYSRVPVYDDDVDNIIGILHIKDYFMQAYKEGFENVNIRDILRRACFVPETKTIDSLFFELQKTNQHMSILIDECGGFSGIVTMEDLIEQIVGDIDDEYDETELEIRKQDDGSYIVGGNTSLYDLNDELGTEISSDNSETVGGFVIELLGEIPEEKVAVSFENYTFTVMSVKDRRIENVLVTIGEDDNSAENE